MDADAVEKFHEDLGRMAWDKICPAAGGPTVRLTDGKRTETGDPQAQLWFEWTRPTTLNADEMSILHAQVGRWLELHNIKGDDQ